MVELLQALDKNNDGYLSKKEFKKISKNMTKEQVRRVFLMQSRAT